MGYQPTPDSQSDWTAHARRRTQRVVETETIQDNVGMASEDSACAEIGGNMNPKQKWYNRALGIPPNSVGTQSDISTTKAHCFAMSNLAKYTQTIHLPDRNP